MTTAEMILGALAIVFGGGNVWTFLTSRGNTEAALLAMSRKIASDTIEGLRDDRKELLDRIDGLEGQIGALKEQLAELLAHAEALEGVLKAQGITPPARPRKRI